MLGTIIADQASVIKRKTQNPSPDVIVSLAVTDWLLNGDTLDRNDLKAFLAKWKQKYLPPATPYSFKNENPILAAVPIGLWAPCPETAFHTARLVAGTIYPTKLRIECTELVAEAVSLAAMKVSKREIKTYLENRYGCDLSFGEKIIQEEKTPKNLQTVETAIRIFLSENSFRKTLNATAGLDNPLASCIACGLAEAYHGIPFLTRRKAFRSLPEDIRKIVKQIQAQDEERRVAQSIARSRSEILNQSRMDYKRKIAG